MAVVLFPEEGIEKICQSHQGCVSNYNSDTQIVISASRRNLVKIQQEIMERNLAGRIVPMKTEGTTVEEAVREMVGRTEYRIPVWGIDPRDHIADVERRIG